MLIDVPLNSATSKTARTVRTYDMDRCYPASQGQQPGKQSWKHLKPPNTVNAIRGPDFSGEAGIFSAQTLYVIQTLDVWIHEPEAQGGDHAHHPRVSRWIVYMLVLHLHTVTIPC